MTDTELFDVPIIEGIETEELHDAVLRIVADLHAAYGSGIVFEVQDASGVGECRNFVLSDGIPTTHGGNAMMVGLWPDAEITVATYHNGELFKALVEPLATPILLDNVRTFMHAYGSGKR